MSVAYVYNTQNRSHNGIVTTMCKPRIQLLKKHFTAKKPLTQTNTGFLLY